jgi:hypothetical protein
LLNAACHINERMVEEDKEGLKEGLKEGDVVIAVTLSGGARSGMRSERSWSLGFASGYSYG